MRNEWGPEPIGAWGWFCVVLVLAWFTLMAWAIIKITLAVTS